MVKMFRGRYEFLSNFYDCEIELDGITYQNSESVFQSLKCENVKDRKQFSNLKGYQAKSLGKQVLLRPNWDNIKISAMYIAVKAKFEQNEDLKLLLLSTKDEHLEEGNCWGDDYWGTVNGIGKNMLGKILMKVRQELLEQI